MRVTTLLVTAAVVGLAACDSNTTEPTRPSLTGEWTFTFKPSAQSASSDGSVVPRVYLKDADGVLTGYLNGYNVVGRRSGNSLELTVLTQKGTFPLAVSFLQLHAVSADSVEGTGQTPLPATTPGGGASVSSGAITGTRLAELSDAVIDAKLANPNAPIGLGGGWATACDLISTGLSFVIGDLTDKALRPMGGCWLTMDGAGFYLFGRDAPGSMLPLWTQNMYVPTELIFPKPWEDPCPSRWYDFTFSYKGSQLVQDANQMLDYSKDARGSYLSGISKFLDPGQMVDGLVGRLNAFKDRYGDYAFILATHPRTKWIGLYVIHQKGLSTDAAGDALVRTVAKAFNAEVFAGSAIHDKYELKRNFMPGVCGDYIVFAYLLGTASVDLD